MKTQFVLLFLFAVGCSPNNQQHPEESILDSIALVPKTIEHDSIEISAISDRLFRIAQILDSCGFIFDTTRFNKSYNRYNIAKSVQFNGYQFYNVDLKNTIPYGFFLRCDTTTSSHTLEWCKLNQLNITSFRKATKINQYFYISKSFHDLNYNGEKYFPDGIAEEWCFPDSHTAREASQELAAHEAEVYINCTGFICFADNCMYVFHSRAINFMYSIRPYFKLITRDINATQANKSLLGD